MKILVAEDEFLARERLCQLVTELGPPYAIGGAVADGAEAVRLCMEHAIDVALLDVRMPVMDGLQAAARMTVLEPPPAVIFVTAYDNYALSAFERRAADYLVKPVRKERLRAALERVQVPTRAQQQTLSAGMAARRGGHRQLSANFRGGVRSVAVEEVIYLRAEQKYVTLLHTGGILLVEESLKSLEQEFADLFLRIHRNTLVAKRFLAGIEKADDGVCVACLRDRVERLPISRRHLSAVRGWLRRGPHI